MHLEQVLIEAATTQGIWVLLFVSLFLYTIKNNEKLVEKHPGILSFTLVHNPGASLGMGSNMTWLISLLAIVACVALAVLAIRTISMKWTVVFALAFAGALGNLIDRVMYAEGFLNGKVVDFLNYGWSVGNVADIFLMVAGVAAVVLLFVGEPFSQKDLDEQAAEQTKQTTGDQNA